jgi:excinuclease ABC subunit A
MGRDRGTETDGAGADEPPLIRVRGARVHNLRNVDADLPRDRLVVLTGVSGSGKSSLAFDTLYAEGQRRYIESLSSYARQFLDQLERPDVDAVEGLPPTVSIDQRAGASNPRSTVGTVTEIHDYLRVLFARAGTPHCPRCGVPIRRQTPEQMVATVLAMREGRKVILLAPIVRGRKGQHAEGFQAIRRAGLLRARVDGEVIEVTPDDPKLARTKPHDIEAVVDRLVVREGIRPRLAESIDLALKLGGGTVLVSAQTESGWEDTPLSVHFACPSCGAGLEELEPRTFSFNSPYGACPRCDGLGTVASFDPDLIITDRSLSLDQGAVPPELESVLNGDGGGLGRSSVARTTPVGPAVPAKSSPAGTAGPTRGKATRSVQEVDRFLARHKLSRSRPLSDWTAAALQTFLQGPGGEKPSFPGLLPQLEQAYQSARSERLRAVLDGFRSSEPCPECGGTRLRPEGRSVTLAGLTLPQVADLPVRRSRDWFRALTFDPAKEAVGAPLVREIVPRLDYLDRVGVGYLTLSRGAETLSGGEYQRVRLAGQIGSGLVGVCYILDEPTAGLHPRDTGRLLDTLGRLRDQGNTVIVVEHDEATVRAADWLLDLGPGAGPDGGRVVALGPPDALNVIGPSLTARYLSHELTVAPTPSDRLARSPSRVRILGAAERNLKGIDVEIPTGTLTCVSGVSGSGKSTLVHEILARAARRQIDRRGPKPGANRRTEGLEVFEKLIEVDQSPIGRGPRSTPATYTGLFDEIRKVFAQTREAKVRGYGASRFSFNVKGGRCEECEGQGVRRVEMNFLPDLYVRCETCGGQRFNRQTLEVRFKGKSIGDVLELRVDEARALFDAQPRVKKGLDALHEAGLGYIGLGQSSTTLSGGEAQRVKLAAELGRSAPGRTLYILDEPTTGLHFDDVARLLHVLHRLADLGHTVVVIEHNTDVLKTADWLIDLGPDGGENGGSLLAMGPPKVVAAAPDSATGRYLKSALGLP